MAKVTSSIKKITPAIAKQMLEMNKGNFRPIDVSRVKRYASDMVSGKWLFNGEAIKTNGVMLLDGQHRLEAIVMSGITVETLVVEGLDTSSAISMDKGASRTVASWLKHEGIANAVCVGAIARHALVYEKGLWSHQAVGSYATTDAETIEYVQSNHDRIQSALSVARPAKRFVNISILATIMLKAAAERQSDECDLCMWFCTKLADGDQINSLQAVFHLRNKLMTTSLAGKMSPYMQRGLATLAWNKTAMNETCRVLQFRINGDNPSHVPDVIERCPA